MKISSILIYLASLISMVLSQDLLSSYLQNSFGTYTPLNSNSLLNSLYSPSMSGVRDPRQNTGPVVFPPSPPDTGETSGVVVGASGYGFVPPSSSGIGKLPRSQRFY